MATQPAISPLATASCKTPSKRAFLLGSMFLQTPFSPKSIAQTFPARYSCAPGTSIMPPFMGEAARCVNTPSAPSA